MPKIRPNNADKCAAERPELAEEIPAFHKTRLGHSMGSDPALVAHPHSTAPIRLP